MDKDAIFKFVTIFAIASTIMISLTLIFYVSIHDYILIPLNNFIISFALDGTIPANYGDIGNQIIPIIERIPYYLDWLWLVSFLTAIGELFYISYHSKREGYFQVIMWFTFGIMILLYVSSIFYQMNLWLKTIIIDGLLSYINPQLNFFDFYIANIGLINMIIIIICIILNYIDLDFVKFNTRKDKENLDDEI